MTEQEDSKKLTIHVEGYGDLELTLDKDLYSRSELSDLIADVVASTMDLVDPRNPRPIFNPAIGFVASNHAQ